MKATTIGFKAWRIFWAQKTIYLKWGDSAPLKITRQISVFTDRIGVFVGYVVFLTENLYITSAILYIPSANLTLSPLTPWKELWARPCVYGSCTCSSAWCSRSCCSSRSRSYVWLCRGLLGSHRIWQTVQCSICCSALFQWFQASWYCGCSPEKTFPGCQFDDFGAHKSER